MAPVEEVVNNIGQLLLPTTESGDQDHNSLLDVHIYFNECITEKGIKKHVVILSDGHSSRFDAEVMEYFRDQDIYMLTGPPDTTGVTQLLDQINQSLHSQYRSQKKDLFTEDGTTNCEGFMQILGNMWRNWA